MRRLAPAVMARYRIDIARVRLVAEAFNTTFRIDGRDGHRYALRVGAAWRLNTDAIAEVEANWAAALRADTRVCPPQVIRTHDGAPSTWVTADDVPEARECTLFTWQEGRRLHDRIGDLRLAMTAGETLAILHEHGVTTDSASPDQVLRADRVCYFRVPSVLAERHGAVFAEGLAWTQEGLDELWSERGSAAHLLHGDFHANNLLTRKGSVVPIDFQDAIWGLEEQDLAITLVSLESRDAAGAARAAFRRGYERRRRWPDLAPATLDLLKLARRLHVANLMLHVWPDAAPTVISGLRRDLRAALSVTS